MPETGTCFILSKFLDSLPVCEVSVSPRAGLVSSTSIVWINTMWIMVLPFLRPMTQELIRKYPRIPSELASVRPFAFVLDTHNSAISGMAQAPSRWDASNSPS